MKLLAAIFYAIEVGAARSLVRLIPLAIVVLGIIAVYNIRIYKGLNDLASMDNAQLGRQLSRHEGFHTYFIRPYALNQVSQHETSQGRLNLFPGDFYTDRVPRSIPDTYNSPGYPLTLAAWFAILGANFDEPPTTTAEHHMFAPDRLIPPLNEIFILLTAVVMFVLGWRLFDHRVAWLGSVAFLVSQFVWNYSLVAVPINLLMLLMTLFFLGATEVDALAERKADELDGGTLGWAWLVVPALAVLLGMICLNSLLLLILLLPFTTYLLLMRRTNWGFPFLVIGVVALMVIPWFIHWRHATGNFFGSNLAFGLLGANGYTENQIYCATSVPVYDHLLGDFGTKQYNGFLYYFQHGWSQLGATPLILLFAASLLHEFRRRRVQAFRWLVVGCAFAIIFMTNLGDAKPDPLGPWNLAAILIPAMTLIGAGFFFTLLDRLVTQLPLLNVTIIVALLAITVAPILLVFTTYSGNYYNYPPYLPPYISYLSRLTPGNQWVTTDIPWATAWYGDRPSLWLPDSVDDFSRINNDICESEMILITPETLGKPVINLTTGEQKDWMPIVLGIGIPDNFPLHHFVKLPSAAPNYLIISNSLGEPRH